ncbi:MAG: hypothetical protein NTW87_19275, partial [Planctomycetota bacterium]|nr:hypothetical protein [Planctomycetota bacterium]
PEETDKDKENEEAKETEATDKKEEEEWTAPPGLPGFPENAKRLAKDKEAVFTAALGRLATMDEAQRKAAEDEINALGPGVMPYLVAGCFHTSVPARSSCMYMIGRLSGRNATKQTIEVFYAALPGDDAEPPTYQGPFLEAIKTALPAITGQDFFTGDPRRPIVHQMIKRYVEWYDANYDRLPPQLGEKEIEATDPDYMEKLKKERALKLERKSWPQPPLSADIVAPTRPGVNRETPTAKQMIRPADKAFEKSIPTLKAEDAFKR